MRMLQEENIWIVGTAGEADHTLYQSKMTGRLALVMGAKRMYASLDPCEHCDELISIPMAEAFFPLNVCCKLALFTEGFVSVLVLLNYTKAIQIWDGFFLSIAGKIITYSQIFILLIFKLNLYGIIYDMESVGAGDGAAANCT